MEYLIREMTIDDYDQVFMLWKTTDGIDVDESDTREYLEKYFRRNPHLSYVAETNKTIIGTIKGGQDGRRGYLYHLVVVDKYRRYGIAKELIERCIEELKRQEIWKCNIYIMNSNTKAFSFWQHNGWKELDKSFTMMQKKLM